MTDYTLEQQQALARARARIRAGDQTAGESFARGAGLRFANNMLAMNPMEGTMKLYRAGLNFISDGLGDKVLPKPRAEDLFAGAQLGGEAAAAITSGSLEPWSGIQGARDQQLAATDTAKSQHPIAFGTGQAAGDAATLLMMRAPVVRALSGTSLSLPALSTKPGMLRALDDVLHSGPVVSLAKTAGRATEAGIEGAILATLNDGDPLETAAYSAGAQTLGTAMLGMTDALTAGGPLKAGMKIALAAGSIASILQLGKEAMPGGRDRILESIETGYSKVMWGLMLGGLAGMAGFGRLGNTRLAENMPVFADALTAIPRGMVISKINDVLKSEEAGDTLPTQIVMRAAQDPSAFSKFPKIQKAIADEGTSLSDAANELRNDPEFQRALGLGPTPPSLP